MRSCCAFTVLCVCLATCAVASAVGPYNDIRRGGVIGQSYGYHHQQVQPGSARAGGGYDYGFPVETYRWGWFGVEHYYPVVIWHNGYNGERVRWAYRKGY